MASQTVVVVAMGLVSIAGAVALYQHAALPGPVAATAGLAAYLLLLTGHLLAWRSGSQRAGSETSLAARDRREHELHRVKHDARQGPAVTASGLAKAARDLAMPAARDQALPPALPPQSRGEPFGRSMPLGNPGELAPQSAMRPNADAARPTPPPLPPLQPLAATQPAAPAQSAPVSNSPLLDDDSEDYWSFRPAAAPARQTLPPFVTGRVSGQPSETALPGAAARPGAPHSAALPPLPGLEPKSPREADVEVIQDAIKRLLEEVNATEAEAQNAPRGAARAAQPEAAVDRSIDALRMTADSMRSALDHREPPALPVAPKTPAAQQPPPLPPFVRQQQRAASPSDVLARRMADAIAAGRIDVALEPILGLEDQQTRHYEVSVRLRDADGRPIELTANSPDLRGTGLLPLFDAVRVTRTAAVARRLDERGKGGSVFSTFSGESVADEHFLGELAETLHQRGSLATQLVLSFTQSDVRGFSTPEWDSLADMRALGFRFALSHLTDVDMDFEALAEQGFAFVKLDADVFLSGLPAPSGRLPSSDVCRHLASHGLALVVDGIASDDQLARVFGFGVLLGQGQLFGGARPVRADVVNTSRTAAA